MGVFRETPREVVDARHRAARGGSPTNRTPPRPPPDSEGLMRKGGETRQSAAQYRNIENVLSLGSTRYVSFRGQAYACPPVPWQLGARVMDVYTRTLTAANDVASGHREARDAYRGGLAQLARLLWRGMRPCGPWRRAFWRLHLLRNPFATASDQEMAELTDFFLAGRMTSSVRPTSAPVPRAPKREA